MAKRTRLHTRHHQPSTPVDLKEQQKAESRAEDSRLIHAALGGDATAYKRLMQKYHDAIYHFIYRMVHDKHHVEDLTQEAFIKAFHSLASFNEEYAFSTWLYKIAANNSIDYIRRRKLQTFSIDKPIEAKDTDYAFELPDETYETDKEMISTQRAAMLNEAIKNLPEKYRRVIHLRHVEEKSYEEIAEELRLPIGTVKAHIFRAREMLYKRLKDTIRNY
ncbi:MAG: RNA polymerase subunit sigma-24 [Ignavibacteria bacterium]